MIKGLYAAVSAMIAGVNKQSLRAHNIANLNTPGFKQVFTTLQEFQQSAVFPTALNSPNVAQQPVGEHGLGVQTTETRTKFTDGALQATNQPFDFAIQGDGFFRVMTPDGERFTRDGRFMRDANADLVTVDGNRVLDASGNPIQISEGELSVDSHGGVQINGASTTQLGIAEFAQPETQLEKDGGNLFRALEAPPQTITNSTIHQGYLEMSNVNVVDMMMSARTYEAAQKMAQNHDELLAKSLNTLGKLT